jgi:tetratricopeptide (TPR) repeat protein
VEPDNAYLWFNLGGAQIQSGREEQGFDALRRAVELLPERGSLRGHLARLLEQSGRLDEAEEHFRRLLLIEPENPVVYFWLARFLFRHRPDAQAEALRLAQQALALPPRGGLPREEIEKLINQIQSLDSPDDTPVIESSPRR